MRLEYMKSWMDTRDWLVYQSADAVVGEPRVEFVLLAAAIAANNFAGRVEVARLLFRQKTDVLTVAVAPVGLTLGGIAQVVPRSYVQRLASLVEIVVIVADEDLGRG